MDPISCKKDGCPLLRVHIQPRAAQSRCCGLHGAALKLAIAAPPVDGKANKAAIKYIAELFELHHTEVVLLSGQQSRRKMIGFPNLTERQLRERLTELLS